MKKNRIIINLITNLFFLIFYTASGISLCQAQVNTEVVNVKQETKKRYLAQSNNLTYHNEFKRNDIKKTIIRNTATKYSSDEGHEKNCKEIKKRIDFVKIILKTYADRSLREKVKNEGGTTKEYQKAVEKQVMGEIQSESGTKENETETLMQTTPSYSNPECTIIHHIDITGTVDGVTQILITYNAKGEKINETKYLSKFQDNYKKEYGEKVGPCRTDAMIKHEEHHVKQFVDLGKTISIDHHANRELEAFRVELNKLKKCFRKSMNCCDLPSMQDICPIWQGFLSLNVTKRYQCNEKEQGSEIKADDIETQKANISIDMDDFDFSNNPSISGTHLLQNASGEMTITLSNDHFTANRADKTWCYNKIWKSPGNWHTNYDTSLGQAFRKISKKNINLLIVKDMELNKGAIQNLQQQIQKATKDKDYVRVQKLSNEMTEMVQGNQNNDVIPIRIRVEISFGLAREDFLTNTFEYKKFEACLGSTKENDGSNTIKISLALPMITEMKGTYTKGKDGADTITATINTSINSQDIFGSGKCPDAITIVSGEINLNRQQK